MTLVLSIPDLINFLLVQFSILLHFWIHGRLLPVSLFTLAFLLSNQIFSLSFSVFLLFQFTRFYLRVSGLQLSFVVSHYVALPLIKLYGCLIVHVGVFDFDRCIQLHGKPVATKITVAIDHQVLV